MIKISELQMKDVVNVSDGRKLGNISDLDIDLKTGRIKAIIIPPNGKVFGFFSKEEPIIVPWFNIVKIGSDVILVRFDTNSVQYPANNE